MGKPLLHSHSAWLPGGLCAPRVGREGESWVWFYLPEEMSGRAKLSPPGLLTFLSHINPQSRLPSLPPQTTGTLRPVPSAPGSQPAHPREPPGRRWPGEGGGSPALQSWPSPGLESNGKMSELGRLLALPHPWMRSHSQSVVRGDGARGGGDKYGCPDSEHTQPALPSLHPHRPSPLSISVFHIPPTIWGPFKLCLCHRNFPHRPPHLYLVVALPSGRPCPDAHIPTGPAPR